MHNIIAGLAEALDIRDLTDEGAIAEADHTAGAGLRVALTYIQQRHGRGGAEQIVRSFFEIAAQAAARDDVGGTIPVLHPAPRKDLPTTVQGRAEIMFGYLNERPQLEADVEAKASIWAAAAYLRNRHGEGVALDHLRAMQAKMSLLAWFEQLPAASAARN